jgi:hypothetical protein
MRWRVLLAFVAGLAIAGACTPAQMQAAAPALTRVACVLLHALANDGTTDTICASAEELAPLVPQLLADRAELGAEGPPEADAAPVSLPAPAPTPVLVSRAPAVRETAVIVAELPAPRRRVVRRRCVAWTPVAFSGDAGKDAAAARASDGGPDAAAFD